MAICLLFFIKIRNFLWNVWIPCVSSICLFLYCFVVIRVRMRSIYYIYISFYLVRRLRRCYLFGSSRRDCSCVRFGRILESNWLWPALNFRQTTTSRALFSNTRTQALTHTHTRSLLFDCMLCVVYVVSPSNIL